MVAMRWGYDGRRARVSGRVARADGAQTHKMGDRATQVDDASGVMQKGERRLEL